MMKGLDRPDADPEIATVCQQDGTLGGFVHFQDLFLVCQTRDSSGTLAGAASPVYADIINDYIEE